MPALHAFNWQQQLKAIYACEASNVDEHKHQDSWEENDPGLENCNSILSPKNHPVR